MFLGITDNDQQLKTWRNQGDDAHGTFLALDTGIVADVSEGIGCQEHSATGTTYRESKVSEASRTNTHFRLDVQAHALCDRATVGWRSCRVYNGS